MRLILFGMLILIVAGCSRREAAVEKLPAFFTTNDVVDGKLRQVLETTNGLSLYFTESYVVVWFGGGYDTVIGFDPKTIKPKRILWDIPASSSNLGEAVFDVNADGVPDVRELKNSSRTHQIFFRGEWYTRKTNDTQTIIMIDGKEQRVFFDGQRWVEEPTNSEIVITNTLVTTRF